MTRSSNDEVKPLIATEDVDGMNFSIDADDDLQLREADSQLRVPDGGIREHGTDVARPIPKGGPIEQWEAYEVEERRQVGGAAAAGAIAGLMFAGPLGALILGIGGAALATTRGKAGDVTRATGEVMAKAGDKLKEMDHKHHIVEQAANGVKKSADWVSDKLKPKDERRNHVTDGLTA